MRHTSSEHSSAPSWNPYYEQGNFKDYQYDSYSPKFNENSEGHGYQDSHAYQDGHGYQETYRPSDYDTSEYVHHPRGSSGSDMYSSASSHRSKKIPSSSDGSHRQSSSGSHRHSHGKRSKPHRNSKSKHRTAKRYSIQSRDLDRDLTPPPADK